DSIPTLAGTYRWQASYSGDAENAAISMSSCLESAESAVVSPAVPVVPVLSWAASAPATIGGPVSDTATLSGGNAPTGTMTFALFGPLDPTCAGPAAFTSTVPVSGNGSYGSGPFTPASPGAYLYVASYSGDASNLPVSSGCAALGQSLVVLAAAIQPSLSSIASPPVAVGRA